MNYDQVAEALAYEAAFLAAAFDNPDFPLDELGDVALELVRKLHALGVLGLLATGDNSHFFENLKFAGEYRNRYLRKVVSKEEFDLHHYVNGRLDPIHGLIAANELSSVVEMSSSLPKQFRLHREYRDDFLQARILVQLSTNLISGEFEDGNDAIDAALQNLMEYHDDEFSSRYEILSSFRQADRDRFLENFEIFLSERLEEIEQKKVNEFEDNEVIVLRKIYIEGLAFLNVARLYGFDVAGDYAMCPLSAQHG